MTDATSPGDSTCAHDDRANLPPGRVDLWCVRPGEVTDPGLLERYAALLSADEAARRRRFLFEKDRHRFLVTRALARSVLSWYAGGCPEDWTFTTNAYGRPEVLPPPDAPVRFNLSHTAGLIVCAVAAAGELGVDVEWIEPGRARVELARRFFAPDESAALEHLPPEGQTERFYDYWTLKESYIKARGMGLAIPLSSFAFELSDDAPPRLACRPECGDEPAGWQFGQIRFFGTHQAAVALRLPPGDRLPSAVPLEIVLRRSVPLVVVGEPCLLPPSRANRWSLPSPP